MVQEAGKSCDYSIITTYVEFNYERHVINSISVLCCYGNNDLLIDDILISLSMPPEKLENSCCMQTDIYISYYPLIYKSLMVCMYMTGC